VSFRAGRICPALSAPRSRPPKAAVYGPTRCRAPTTGSAGWRMS